MKTVYDKIEEVLKAAKDQGLMALAPHDFNGFSFTPAPTRGFVNAREYVGCSESALGRRLREMRELGRVTSQTRSLTAFKEYALAVKQPVAAEPELAGQHSGGL